MLWVLFVMTTDFDLKNHQVVKVNIYDRFLLSGFNYEVFKF